MFPLSVPAEKNRPHCYRGYKNNLSASFNLSAILHKIKTSQYKTSKLFCNFIPQQVQNLKPYNALKSIVQAANHSKMQILNALEP